MTTNTEAMRALRIALEDFDSMESLGPTTEKVIAAAQELYLSTPRTALAQAEQPRPTSMVSEVGQADARYWLESRQKIIDAISRAGYALHSNASGFWLEPVQPTAWVGLTEEEHERALFEANTKYKHWVAGGPCGQMALPQDDPAWHVWQAIESALRAKNASSAGAWQPIETAPKDGLVDICSEDRRYAECHYDRICSEWRHITACGVLIRLKKATHWMRPPPAPITALRNQEGGKG